MKQRIYILFLYGAALLCTLTACDNSKPGKWTDDARQKVHGHCLETIPAPVIKDSGAFCKCLVAKLEQQYSPEQAEDKMKLQELSTLTESCYASTENDSLQLLPGSKWTLAEKQVFLSTFGKDQLTPELRRCVAEQFETKYAYRDLPGLSEKEIINTVLICQKSAKSAAQ